jgi:hypothetical protein
MFGDRVPPFKGDVSYLVVLPDDPMSEVFEVLRDRYADGTYLLTTEDHCKTLSVVAIRPSSKRRSAAKASEEDEFCPIHPDTLVAMFLAYLRLKDEPVVCHLLSPTLKIELIPA